MGRRWWPATALRKIGSRGEGMVVVEGRRRGRSFNSQIPKTHPRETIRQLRRSWNRCCEEGYL